MLAYQHAAGGRPQLGGCGLDWYDFMSKRVASLYPLYLLSLALGYVISMASADVQPLGLLLVLLLCASAFVPSAMMNAINTPGWTVGAFFVLYALFPYCTTLIQVLLLLRTTGSSIIPTQPTAGL